MTASLAVSGSTQAVFSNIVANVPAEGSRPQVVVTQGQITVDVSTSPPGLTGFADFQVADRSATMTLTEDASGDLSIIVEGDDFTFTVP